MTSKEFTIWLKGFTTACNDYAPTPKQWDTIKEELDKVTDNFEETPGMFEVHKQPPYPGTPIGEGGWGTPNHDLVDRYPWGGQKVWGGAGTAGTPINCLTTSGSFGTTTPGFAITTTPGYGSISYNPSTTTQMYPSGSLWHYTNNNYINPYKPFSTSPDKPKKKKKDWENEIELGGSE